MPDAAFVADWHEYECPDGHRWWSAPTSTCCPVCGAMTYKSLQVAYGEIFVAREHNVLGEPV